MGTAIQRLEAALKAHDCHPHGKYAKCPAHGGNDDDSLTFGEGDNGSALVTCHSKGCSFAEIVSALGLTPADLGPTNGNGGRPEIVARYPYHDAHGELLFEVVRLLPKSFRQCRPDGQGGIVWGLSAGKYERKPGSHDWYTVKDKPTPGAEVRDFPQVGRVLYRLPEILAAVQAGRPAYIPEGEKDCGTLVSWGLDATCNPGGAGKWRAEYSETLRGAQVVILPDQDEPGREHGRQVAEALCGIAAEAVVVNLPTGKDVTEWAAGGGGREALLALVEAAQQGALPTAPKAAPPSAPALRCDELPDFMALVLPPRELILDPWFRRSDLAMLYGWRGLGKTYTALLIALAVASGGRALRWRASTPRGVCYVDGEMPAGTLQARLAALATGGELVPTAPFRIIAADRQEEGLPSLSTPAGQDAIEEHLDGISLLILDNLSCLFRGVGAENEAESWSPAQEWLLRLRRRGLSVLLVHHAGKGGGQRGTSRREDILDTVLALRRPSDYSPVEGARFEAHFEKARGIAGKDVEPFEARLDTDQDGAVVWTMRDLEDRLNEQIIELAKAGMTTRAIAKEVGRDHSRIVRRLKEARQRGLL